MADETYRRYHSGRFPVKAGATGQASYEAGSNTGYYKQDESGQPVKSTAEEIDLSATKALRKTLGVTSTGELGTLGGLRTKRALEE